MPAGRDPPTEITLIHVHVEWCEWRFVVMTNSITQAHELLNLEPSGAIRRDLSRRRLEVSSAIQLMANIIHPLQQPHRLHHPSSTIALVQGFEVRQATLRPQAPAMQARPSHHAPVMRNRRAPSSCTSVMRKFIHLALIIRMRHARAPRRG